LPIVAGFASAMSSMFAKSAARFKLIVERHPVARRSAMTDWHTSIAPPPDNGPASAQALSRRRDRAVGRGRSSTDVAALVDTNILVYRFDSRFPEKQTRATKLLREGIADDSIRVAHQALLEFVAATTRPLARGGPSILSPHDARREMEDMLVQFEILYPDEELVRVAIRGAATYGLSWFDAHMWAYAERFGIDTLWSEDFEHGRFYGRVRATDPFVP
jgi:predicted nucleic acid-binding protein